MCGVYIASPKTHLYSNAHAGYFFVLFPNIYVVFMEVLDTIDLANLNQIMNPGERWEKTTL